MSDSNAPPRKGGSASPFFDDAEGQTGFGLSQFEDSSQALDLDLRHPAPLPTTEDAMGRMGQAFLNARKLTEEEVVRIVQLQRKKRIRFGEAAIQLGLLTEEDVHDVLAQQFNYQTSAKHGQGSRKKISSRLLISHSPYSAEAEAIRRFRAEIRLRAGDQDQTCLVFALVSPNTLEGKSHLAASLALAFAQLNLKTLLIDANLRKPIQHQLFDLSNKTGLSTMLAGRTLPTLDLSDTINSHLNVITSGPKPPNPSEILTAPNLSELLDKFKTDAKVIVIDTPPTRVGADAQIIAPQAGNVVLVCRKDSTTADDLHKTYHDMETASARVLGSFFNTVPQKIAPVTSRLRQLLGRVNEPPQEKG